MMTIEQATAYLLRNRALLNISEIADRLKVDRGNFSKMVKGDRDNKGTFLKIPRRCLPELEKIIVELQNTFPRT